MTTTHDLLIRGGRVADGLGSPLFEADVAREGWLGDHRRVSARRSHSSAAASSTSRRRPSDWARWRSAR